MSKQSTPKEILNIDKESIWNIDEGLYKILHDDNVIIENTKNQLIFNRYCWDLYLLYPSTPIVSNCNIKFILGDSLYNADTHIKILENIFSYICQYNKLNTYTDKNKLLETVYIVYNNIYNNVVHRASKAVFTIDATDFIEIVNSDDIKKIHNSISPTPESIEIAYNRIKTVMKNFGTKNRFSKAFNSKAINENQANQCIGPRGFISDLDRTVFKTPVMNGFIRGLNTLYEIMAESRTAAKSLNANDTHIRTSEYASRRIQLLTMSVDTVVHGDCGSTEYMNLFITPTILKNIKGKYYLNENGDLNYIKGDETILHDKVIKVRGVLQCKYHIANKICSTCLGKVSENFKENSNLGYIATAYLMEKTTQSILSTKHLTHSVRKSAIELEGLANKYFYADLDNYIYFNKDIDLKDLVMVLPNNRLNKLIDVLNIKHNNIALNKIGELEEICIIENNHKTPVSNILNISYKDRTSIITSSLLNYIKNINMETDARGNFIIKLNNFNKDKPVFYNPLKETDMISFVNRVTSIIETNKKGYKTPEEKLNLLFEHVLDKFNCNIFILEIIAYATSIYNPYNYNYSLSRNSEHRSSESRINLFRHRSLGALFVLEERSEIIKNAPIIFNPRYRIDHPMDVLFTPDKIINQNK